MYKVAICDDCKEYRKTLITYMKEVNGNVDDFLIYQYDSGEKLIEHKEMSFDLIFLDMQLPGAGGNEVAKEIRKNNTDVVLVFCSGVLMPSPQSFVVKPFRYLVKQQIQKDILAEMRIILNNVKIRSKIQYLNVTSDGAYTKIPVHEILYVSIIKRGSEIHLKRSIPGSTNILKTNKKLPEIQQELENYHFVLIHKSYLANMNYIAKFYKEYLILDDGTQLQVSRSKRLGFENAFNDFLRLKY